MKKNINTIKMLGIDMINKSNSGHPGIVLGAATMMYTLFDKHLKINIKAPKWINRDRFVMSAGHGSALLYAMMHVQGYDLTMDDIKNFRQLHSKTPGHPENFITSGVDATSGPLGQGIAHAIGIAIGEVKSADLFNTDNHKIIDHYTYALCGDGDLQEGVAQESMSLAGHLALKKLIVLYDSNKITLDGELKLSNTENTKLKMEAINWNYILVNNGEDVSLINDAIEKAKKSNKPTMIEIKTIIGMGSPSEGTSKAHGSVIGKEGREILAKNLDYKNEPFIVEEEVYEYFIEKNKEHLISYENWLKIFEEWKQENKELNHNLEKALSKNIKIDITKLPKWTKEDCVATRVSSGKVLDELQKQIPWMIGGSADLSSSTKIKGINGTFSAKDSSGNNINYGIREFGMAAINNGIALHGILRPFSSGFFVFSDYAKPAIRLSSLMNTNSLHLYTHDSIAVGEDGPTHQPIEQIAGFRAQPGLYVFRPCDANEVSASYKIAMELKDKPSMILLSRQNLDMICDSAYNALKGGYILKEGSNKKIDKILIATGSEVSLALEIAKKLEEQKKSVRVVSMPCIELFEEQDKKYKESVINANQRNITTSIEMSSDKIWYKYASKVIGVDSFGISAPAKDTIKEFGFNIENLLKLIIE